MNLIDWIDKKLESIKTDNFFIGYFNGIAINAIEDSNYLSNQAKGIELVLTDNLLIESIHLFSKNYEGNNEYKGRIPHDLEFGMTRVVVNLLLGKPDKCGGGYQDVFGYVPHWDKYFFENYSLHVQYSMQTYIDLITIGSLSLEAYFNIGLQ